MPSIRENTSITQVARKACVALIVVFVFVALVVWLQMQATYVADGRLCAQIRFRVVDRVLHFLNCGITSCGQCHEASGQTG